MTKEDFDNLIVNYVRKINETTEFLKEKGIPEPDAGIILGTGLGGLTSRIKVLLEFDYKDIPTSLFQQLKVMKAN